ncbi:MAG: thioesterase family protein [Pseudomonadota bacterium]
MTKGIPILDSLKPGLKHEAAMKVTEGMLVPNVSANLFAFADMPPVFATAMMVGFIEATCIECLRGHLDGQEHTVGTHVNVSHIAATPENMSVRAVVELTQIDRKMLTFKVEAFDDKGLIGEGSHQRAVINLKRFVSQVSEKSANG